MAISPEECLTLTENEKNQVKDLEREIDANLKERYDSTVAVVEMSVTIVSTRVYNQIVTLYRNAGWEVNAKGVGVKGDRTLSFKKKLPSSSGWER